MPSRSRWSILAYGAKYLRGATPEAHSQDSAEMIAVGDLD